MRLSLLSLSLTHLNRVTSRSPRFLAIQPSRLYLSSHLNKPPRFVSLKINKENFVQVASYSNQDQVEKQPELTSAEKQKTLIWTIPNFLTSLRIISIPFINYFVLTGQHDIACGLFVASALTDALDGYIARNVPNQLSHLGSILDPLADKLLIGSLTFTLMFADMMPFPLFAIIIGRDLGLILSSLFIRYQIIDEPKTFQKYINLKKYASVKIEADTISKFNTVVQVALISATLPSVLMGYSGSDLLIYLQYFTGFTTLLSSASYLYKRGSYKLK